ncbi:MAG: MotA/TolQ/ExbB proton channel family protein [Verrucomicrobiales bacterium]|jgi:biopolymer transport protein ExbB|nr:MotA/TolQ/ExbB proton channel family protein [Verrucomicrobiales bacterium]MDR1305766.1 MotA/TolQ/ExbB proton channel family protein [Verrucomicrobiales bacterium]
MNKLMAAAVAVLGVIGTTPLLAQEAADGGQKEVKFTDVFFHLSAEAIVLWILLIGSVVMISFIIELFIRIRAKALMPPAVVALLQDAMNTYNYQVAFDTCKANQCFLTQCLGPAIKVIGLGKHAVEEALNENFAKYSVQLKSRNNYLSVIGVVAPMIGLTGTVLGMMKAFATLGQSGVANMTGLSSAISEVLIATASGLTVAIPAFIFFYYFKNVATSVFTDAHTQLKTLLRNVPYDQLAGFQVADGEQAAQQ